MMYRSRHPNFSLPSDKLINFRPAFPDESLTKARVFRSISSDQASEEAISELQYRYNIRTIIDLQSKNTYLRFAKRGSTNPINRHYTTFYVQGKNKKCLQLSPSAENETPPLRHYIIDFIGLTHYVAVFFKLTIWQMLATLYYILRHLFNHDYYFEYYVGKNYIGPNGLLGQLAMLLETCQISVLSVFRLLADESNYPLMINCTIGKDRTGLIVMLILDLMEVPHDSIVKGFSDSAIHLRPVEEQLRTFFYGNGLTEDFVTANPQVMIGLLRHLKERYGGAKAYLQHIGLSNEEIAQIKRNLRT